MKNDDTESESTYSRSIDGQALSYALRCSFPEMKASALRRVKAAIVLHDGATTKIAGELGIAVATYQGWLKNVPEVRDAHYEVRPEVVRGRKPRVLMTPHERRKADAAKKP